VNHYEMAIVLWSTVAGVGLAVPFLIALMSDTVDCFWHRDDEVSLPSVPIPSSPGSR
jgi:hypothetical protein